MRRSVCEKEKKAVEDSHKLRKNISNQLNWLHYENAAEHHTGVISYVQMME